MLHYFNESQKLSIEKQNPVLGLGVGDGVAAELQMLTSNLSAGCQGSGLEPQASERMEMFFGIMRT